ncbi:MAG: NADH-quinone oxidoreductase subunit NuoH [Deltaproteobacteria bacterium]|nr:NADH-quinone oxidoreductase subunit NuoH [Deltaproteobacteria bacterium]
MQPFIDQIISECEILQGLPLWFSYLIFQLIFCGIIFVFVAVFAMLAGYAERRVAGRIQSRIGPNRVGPQGILQSLADGIKVFLKEDIIPTHADHILFRLAPYFIFIGMFLSFVAIPFSSQWVIADLDIGIFYLLAVESLVVIGIVMSGWASNNKWSLLGGMRSAAQIVSYEVPVALTILLVVMYSGTMSIQGIIMAQGAAPWNWNIFQTPFLFVAFFPLFMGSLAEGNRMPFDMPEAESELVSGYNTEYSGFRFVIFFFAEFSNLYLIGALATVLFFGGWQAGPLPDFVNGLLGIETPLSAAIVKNLVELCVFMFKSLCLVFIVIQLRWTLPRVRVDQLMNICWKYLVPVAFFNLVVMGIWMVVVPEYVTDIVALCMTACGVLLLGYFFYRVAWQLKNTKARLRFNPLS